MQLHSVTKTLSRALVLLALVAFTASAFAQQRYVITNGDAVKRDHAYVGDKFLAIDYSGTTPQLTVATTFDTNCIWYFNGKPGYYYQLSANGDRYYLMRTGDNLHVLSVRMGHGEVFESATQWYDWTFGMATQELAGDARYYWVILNADGNSWGLSCDTYGRPGINNGDVTNGHSNTATCARYYADGTTSMVAATYTPLLAYEHEGVYEAQAGGIYSGATLNVASAIISGSSVDATVTDVTTYTSTAIPAYTEYQLREVFPADSNPNFPENIDAGTTADDYMYSGGNYYYRLFDITNARQYTSKYYYEGAMHDAAPTAANSNPRTIVSTSWKLSGSGAHYLKVTPTAASTDAAPAATVTAVSPWSSTGMTVTLTYSVTYSDGYTATLSQVIVLAVNPTAVAAEDVHATQGGEAPLSYTLTPAGATATVSISGVEGITYNNENNNIIIASTVAPGEKNLTITATKADGTTVTGTFKVYVHPAPLEYSVADNGAVTFTNLPTDGTVYYTATASDTTTLKDRILNGTYTAATTGTQVSGTLTLTPGQTVYAVAAFGSLRSLSVTKVRNEGPATGVNQTLSDGVVAVVLNDLEDHSWSYYSDPACPIRSLNPADVKITYYGNGTNNMTTTDVSANPTTFAGNASGVKVNIGENENTFVYYKTLEREGADAATSMSEATGNLVYTTIPNPFQVRPTGQDNGSQTVQWTTRQVYVSGNAYNYENDNYVRVDYTDANGNPQTWTSSVYEQVNSTITVMAGTQITLTARGSCYGLYSTITARYADVSMAQIATVTTTSNDTNGATATGDVVATSTTVTSGKYRGFYGWLFSSSTGVTVTDKDGNAFANNIIPAETEVRFVTSSEYGNEVTFTALWAQAHVDSGYNPGVTYERNFVVGSTAVTYPATYSSIYPNGTTDGTTVATSIPDTAYNIARTLSYDSKFENMNVSGNTLTADGHNLIVGRGVSGTVYTVSGLNTPDGIDYYEYYYFDDVNYQIRIESGTYRNISFYAGYKNADGENVYAYVHSNGSNNLVKGILGSDYDRAKGDNNKLTVQRSVYMGQAMEMKAQDSTEKTFDLTIKSGKFLTNLGDDMGTAGSDKSLYMAITSYLSGTRTGGRVVTIEGGEMASIAGGADKNQSGNSGVNSITLRVKNGLIKGAVYGGGAFSPAYGDRKIIVTGGTIKGWIGAGCNGVASSGSGNVQIGGQTNGESFVYVGGNAYVGGYSYNGTTLINGAESGCIFAAGKGSGASNEPNSGQMAYGTNLAIADNAVVEKDVYGGGYYGFADVNANLQILGGTIQGSVFGGANQNKGTVVNVLMKNGTVEGSIYGGSNSSGTITGTVTITVSGGNVKRNVFGGGLGTNTAVTGDVTVTVNGDAHIEGCVYGGGQDGKVNNSTTVNIESGTIDENVYGGGLGTAAIVSGNTTVTIGK